MNYIKGLVAAAVVAAISFTSCSTNSKETDSNKVAEEANKDKFNSAENENDAKFVAETVAGNYAEIQLAQLAIQKSTNTMVKEVAGSLEKEHNKLLKELQSFADKKAISVPVEPQESARKKMEKLTEETDTKVFNKDWCKEMADQHENAIKEFESRFEKTEDSDLKNWISEKLPHLRMHLDQVKACDENIRQENK
ncbi:MAG: hypothetical protein DI538_23900 [Azospira oryzae]|nr:MAG: hypothetical protein DI538_23900 [Azospira oryzae]